MALLHFSNLGVNNPTLLMKNAFYSLKTIYDFLDRSKKYMESDEAVLRLAHEVDTSASDVERKREGNAAQAGVWVILQEPEDSPNEADSTFRAFMDENLREVYECEASDEANDEENPRRRAIQKFSYARKITVLERDPETNRLLLERKPELSNLLLRPNTLTIIRQIDALQGLQNSPSRSHMPLLRLLQRKDLALWPMFEPSPLAEDAWLVLRDANREGTTEQRRFVEIALATPDFAFLEGPPGSGKTTAICELVLQLAKQGKRVLLCASTHVAVDNVLERLMDERNLARDLVIPIRVGDAKSVSDKARPWQLKNFLHTERERLLNAFARARPLSEAQEELSSVISHYPSDFERLVLDAANLVCGTTIGILQHPAIKNGESSGLDFDVLILDEASKTTFQEFLVPATLAKRWVIVGDPKQLSPFVDDVALATNVSACLPSSICQQACLDVFLANQPDPNKRRIAVVAAEDKKMADIYQAQAQAYALDFAFATDDEKAISSAAIVLGTSVELALQEASLPLDVSTLRAPPHSLPLLLRRMAAWAKLTDTHWEEPPQWAEEISWRLARHYEQRFSGKDESSDQTGTGLQPRTAQKLHKQVAQLLPDAGTGADPKKVMEDIDSVRRVALPSILELLRYGFERHAKDNVGNGLTDGLPADVLQIRHVLLSTQHRMHPDIATFSHHHIYHGKALHTPAYIESARAWSYGQYDHRAVWLDVQGTFNGNSNPQEAEAIVAELAQFDRWAKHNRRNGEPWEVAVLSFYRPQERLLRQHLQKWSGQPNALQHFVRSENGRPYLQIDLCTVDRFQGHEADVVFLSLVRNKPTSFLESPNRLNVALTRARYQRVVVGNRKTMIKVKDSLLGKFAEQESWMQQMRRDKHV